MSITMTEQPSKKPFSQGKKQKPPIWLRPTFIPEHGVLLVLFGSFLTGSALAQKWTYSTTWALLCAFFTLLTEHPYIVNLKQRKQVKHRYVFWGLVYGSITILLAIVLASNLLLLIWIYLAVILGFIAQTILVLKRKQKSIPGELINFATICLASPFAYAVSSGELNSASIAMWILNTLFFSSAIYTLKLRRRRTRKFGIGVIYHLVSAMLVFMLYDLGYLSWVTALCFSIALIKLLIIFFVRNWYREARFHQIIIFETRFALLFMAITSISVLPAHLPTV